MKIFITLVAGVSFTEDVSFRFVVCAIFFHQCPHPEVIKLFFMLNSADHEI